MQQTTSILSSASRKAVSDFTSSRVKTNGLKMKAVDSMLADGVCSDMLVAPKKDSGSEEHVKFYADLKALVVLGFNANVQKLLAAETKTLSDPAKADKRYWQQQIGSTIGDLKAAMIRREQQDESNGASNKSSLETRLKKDLTAWISRLEKAESAKFDLVAMIKELKAASALIK